MMAHSYKSIFSLFYFDKTFIFIFITVFFAIQLDITFTFQNDTHNELSLNKMCFHISLSNRLQSNLILWEGYGLFPKVVASSQFLPVLDLILFCIKRCESIKASKIVYIWNENIIRNSQFFNPTSKEVPQGKKEVLASKHYQIK